MAQSIERVDTIPLILGWLEKMGIRETIDTVFPVHRNWNGLSFGQLAVLFVTYVLHMLTHRLSGMEPWMNTHKSVIEQATGWRIGEKDATDDRLGRMLDVFGEDDGKIFSFQLQTGKRIVSAYELPTEIARYDTTSYSVFHESNDSPNGILEFGHSKDNRPDLLQFKQGLGVLDPAGIPLVSDTLPGNRADDRCYVPAWRRMVATVGKPDFLFIADCKAASMQSRATIDHEKGYYLFPLPMTGETPTLLKELVLSPPTELQDIVLEPKAGQEEQRTVGSGFVIDKTQESELEDGKKHRWLERWFVTLSDAHSARQTKAFKDRLSKADRKLNSMKPKKDEGAGEFLERAQSVLKDKGLQNFVRVEVDETVEKKKMYKCKGRPGRNAPYEIIENRKLSLAVTRDSEAIDRYLLLTGWRVFVTNTPAERMSLAQGSQYYRDEYTVERGFHRFKRGSIPALPIFLNIDARIKGLMMLLTIALQVVTSMEFVARRELGRNDESISGLVPGNPRMKTNRPTAERLLSQFDNIHLLIQVNGDRMTGMIVEELTPLQKRILSLLGLQETVYGLNFNSRKIETAVEY